VRQALPIDAGRRAAHIWMTGRDRVVVMCASPAGAALSAPGPRRYSPVGA